MSDISIGHDGEFFLRRESDGLMVCSQGIIPGTKKHPHQLRHCMIHRDNAAAEFGTPEQYEEDGHVETLGAAMDEISGVLAEHGLNMLFQPHCFFEPEQLRHPETLTFGCEPDFDCWSMEVGESSTAEAAGNLRSAGGHIHAGFKWEDDIDQAIAASACEIGVGLLTVLHDDDTVRRQLYGQSGRYRAKPYGIEYRVPSNFWYTSEKMMRLMFRAMRASVLYRKDIMGKVKSEEDVVAIRTAINNSDKPLAKSLLEHYKMEEFYAA